MDTLYPLLFGLVGTALMSGALYLIAQTGTGQATLVKGIGSSIPTAQAGSLIPGAALHVLGGIGFAYAYWGLGRSWAFLSPAELVALGVGVGVLKGVVVSAVLAMVAFDQRPLERMEQAGLGVGLAHMAGHVIYGLTVSVLFGALRVDYMLAY